MKIKHLLFLISFVFLSCGPSKYVQYNYFDRGILYNTAIRLKADFGGDTHFEDPTRKSLKEGKNAKKILRNKSLFAVGKAYISLPFYFKFYFDEENYTAYNSSKDTLIKILTDEKTGEEIYKKPMKKGAVFLYIKDLHGPPYYFDVADPERGVITLYETGRQTNVPLSYWDIFNDYRTHLNPLFIKEKIAQAPVEETQQEQWNKLQILTTILSKIPEYEEYTNLLSSPKKRIKEKYNSLVDSLRRQVAFDYDQEAIDRIADLSENRQVVMLNELHWMPEHRILARKLLKLLREKGFTYLAVEALSTTQDPDLNRRGFPIYETGYYVNEPYFGLFVREALRLGFQLVPYEQMGAEREKEQALNIQKILDKDPEAKIFVYAGIGHIYKANYSRKMMAEYLKEFTGMDPLTIDQVAVIADIEKELAFTGAQNINDKNQVDYYLINNIKPRPEAVYKPEELQTADCSFDELGNHLEEDLLLSVYRYDEFEAYFEGAVPVYNKVLHLSQPAFTIHLPAGEYQFKIWTRENKKVLSQPVSVP